MARRQITLFTDDLDGTAIKEGKGGPVKFSFDGSDYEIDLSAKHKAQLEKALKPFIDAGKKLGKSTKGTGGSRRASSARTGTSAKEIRLWAQSHGYDVPARGRIPSETRDAYNAGGSSGE